MNFILLCLIVVQQVLDLLSTEYALRKGLAAEGNPVLRRLMDSLGIIPTLLLTKGLTVGLAYYLWAIGSTFWLSILAIGYSVVVLNNLWLIFSKKN